MNDYVVYYQVDGNPIIVGPDTPEKIFKDCIPESEWLLNNPIAEKSSLEVKHNEIKSRLLEIDEQSIRPIRAMLQGVDTIEDQKILNKLMDEAEELRNQLK